MAESDSETERVSVRTYVPAYQRDVWDEHAEELDMNRSEFVRTMVQAGRNFFDPGTEDLGGQSDGTDAQSADTDPIADSNESGAAGSDLETQVLAALADDEYLSWEELVAAVTDDIETRLEDTLQELQATDQVRYSGPNGGYTIDEQ